MTSASPNHGERVGTNAPDLIVLHYTGMPDTPTARARLCDPGAEVSAHWLIDIDGTTEALVPEDRRAWHAGAGSWGGRDDVNSFSIGIELANPGDRPFPEPQMAALETLLHQIMQRWSIAAHRVIAHSDLAPDRKSDPGRRFDWDRLVRQGLALRPVPDARIDAPFETLLDRIGYPRAVDPRARLSAFRLRFCPWNEGPENDIDRRIAAEATAALPEYPSGPERPLLIYKVMRDAEWAGLRQEGRSVGAPVDVADGYIHFSTAEQLPQTLARHFAGTDRLRLLAVDATSLGPDLRWEPSRGGALFPHLYREIQMTDVLWDRPITLTAQGHQLPDLSCA